jgi:hypothetical protein
MNAIRNLVATAILPLPIRNDVPKLRNGSDNYARKKSPYIFANYREFGDGYGRQCKDIRNISNRTSFHAAEHSPRETTSTSTPHITTGRNGKPRCGRYREELPKAIAIRLPESRRLTPAIVVT